MDPSKQDISPKSTNFKSISNKSRPSTAKSKSKGKAQDSKPRSKSPSTSKTPRNGSKAKLADAKKTLAELEAYRKYNLSDSFF